MIKELEGIGLTKGEAQVYLTLLKLGESTNSPIARHSELQSSTVYYCLNSLIEKGFVSYVLKGSRKHFSAVNPDQIPKILEEKEKELKEKREEVGKILPKLKSYQGLIKERTTTEVYEGWNGFQTIFREIISNLGKGDSYEAFVIEQAIEEPEMLQIFFTKLNKEVKRKGITLRLISPISLKPVFHKIYGKSFLEKYSKVRYTKETIPVGITLYKDNVVTHVSDEGKPISIKIHNKKLARTYRDYFNHVWKQAKP